jgi:HB1, ASXL, restriction endonuclease HTH domain
MRYHEAAIEVLKAAKHPLTVQEITDQAIEGGLITPTGKTPAATMSAVLYVRLRNDPDLVKLEDRGDQRAKRGSVRWSLRRS